MLHRRAAPGLRRPRRGRQGDRGDRRRGTRPGARAGAHAARPERHQGHVDRLRSRSRRARHSEVRTDGWQGYFDIGKYRYQHSVTNVSASGDPAHVVLPHVHLVSSLVKRWILGTHQGAVSHHQLGYYLDEFTFRCNSRHSRHRGLLFY